jgi:hypothetical protein
MSPRTGDRFRAAALGYLVYGVVYWVGGLYLLSQGVGVAGGRAGGAAGASMAMWGLLGLAILVSIPLLLWHPWPWFDRWVLSRRDFSRLIAVLMAVRLVEVLRVALRPEAATVTAPWGGEISFRAGAVVFATVTAIALILVARAAWARRAA